MKMISLAPPIKCQRCGAMVFPYQDGDVFKAECQECALKLLVKQALQETGKEWVTHLINPTTMSASKRFQELCADIEKQGKSGQLLEILEQNFSDFLAYVESEQMKRCDALAIGVNTLATLAVLKHT